MAGEVVLGIDLGTNYSTAAAYIAGKLRFATDEHGEPCIPSAVHYPMRGAPIAGSNAERMHASDPANTVIRVKRLLGREHGSPSARLFEATSAVRLLKKPHNGLSLMLHGHEHSPPEVAAEILRYLKERAQRLFGGEVRRAVITVPVNAGEAVKQATIQAAKIAGLDVIRLVREPNAAAVAAGLHNFRGERCFMIYDFGGGTFDVTVMHQSGDQFRSLASGGDDCLGGDDFDQRVAKLVAGHIWRSHKVEIQKDAVRWDLMQRGCERVKRALSTQTSAHLRMRDAFSSAGKYRDLDLLLERSAVETQWQELVERSIRVSAETLLQAQKRPPDLAGIVLVGGTSYVPLVRAQVQNVFARPVTQEIDPQTAVAAGAALIAAKEAHLFDAAA